MNVMVIDMIEGFTRRGPLANVRVNALLPKMEEFLRSLPVNSHVIFAHDAHNKDDVEFKRFPVHALAGTDESKVCQELVDACKHVTSYFVPKTTHSAFYKTNAANIIEQEIKGNDWVVVGCLTDMCVIACVFPFLYRGKQVIIVRDLIDTYDAPGHNADEINAIFCDSVFPHLGCKVVTSKELITD